MNKPVHSDKSYLNSIYKAVDRPEYAYFDLIKLNLPLTAMEKAGFQVETKCFGVILSDGNLAPIMEFGDHKTTDIYRLTVQEIDYLKCRLGEEENPYLIARYSHILFMLEKNNSYAHRAADTYLVLARDYLSKLHTEDRHIIGFMELVEAYCRICTTTKYEIEACKQQIKDWLEIPEHHLFYYERLLELIADSKIFKRGDILGYTDKAIALFGDYREDSHIESYLEVCVLLAKKEGIPLKPIYQLMGQTQLDHIEDSKYDTSGLIKAARLGAAAKFYKLAGDKKRSDELLRELNVHKGTVQFDVSSHTMKAKDVTTIIECNQAIAEHHLKQHEKTVFYPMALDRRIVPKADRVSDENDFLRFVTTSYYDINLNSHKLNQFELDRREYFQSFQMGIESSLPSYFTELIKKMEEQKRDFLAEGLHYFEHTWFSKELQNGYADDPQIYAWMPMLRPSLEILMSASSKDRMGYLDFQEQMAFDQLAVKFEGLLRDLCSCIGVTTTKTYEDRIVAKDINELLQSDELKAPFGEEDLRLWQFAFTGSGYNIRNNVAHAFYRPKDYTIALSNILLLAYIKLAKYGNLIKVKSEKLEPSEEQ
jgi:hypothetical protein